MFLLYDLILSLAMLPLLPYALYKGLRYGNLWQGIGERLAHYSPQRLQVLRGRQVYWVHAVSVGEVRACQPLLRAIRSHDPEAAVVLTCMTYTGKEIGQQLEEVDLCLFQPFDLSAVVLRALSQLRPVALLLVETEIWPNLVRQTARCGIPLIMVNGRISDRSFPRYLMAKKILAPLLRRFSHFCMQSRMDGLKIARLGAQSERVEVTGNMKFDLPAPDFTSEDVSAICRAFALPDERMVWVAGSTRQGEEELILTAFNQLLAKGHALNLVLVPRYPERAKAVAELVQTARLQPVLRSEIGVQKQPLTSHQVLVGDTLGEMLKFYACADVVFVGGSLVPVGGHNVLEACMLSKPVLFGPHTQNNKQIVSLLLAAHGGVRVNAANLSREVEALLEDDQLRATVGANGASVYAEHAGAAQRTLATLLKLLEKRDDA